MADEVLSQSEIDKLLSALSDGTVSAEEVKADEEQKKVKTYDFKRPDKFSKDQIRTLQMLHDNFGRLLNTYLSTSLRSMVDVEVASVEQLTYQEFVQSLANPSVIGVLAVPPLKGNIGYISAHGKQGRSVSAVIPAHFVEKVMLGCNFRGNVRKTVTIGHFSAPHQILI